MFAFVGIYTKQASIIKMAKRLKEGWIIIFILVKILFPLAVMLCF